MSCGCHPCTPAPCAPLNFCAPENFGDQFPSLIGPMGPPGGPGTYVENYALLRLLNPLAFTQGYIAQVGGRITALDGGGGIFAYDSTSIAADNGGTIITPAAGPGAWIRTYSGPTNAIWWGATDIGASVNSAIAAITNGAVYIPANSYSFGTTINIDQADITVFGDGPSTVMVYTGIGNAIKVFAAGERFVISDITLFGTGSLGIGIRVENGIGYNAQIKDIYLSHFATQISVGTNPGSVGNLTLENVRCDLFAGTVGVRMNSVNGSTLLNCSLQGSIGISSTGLVLDGCTNIRVIGGVIEFNSPSNIVLQNSCFSIMVNGVYFEDILVGDVSIDIAANTKGVTMTGCFHAGNGVSASAIKIRDGAKGIALYGNRWDDYITAVIDNQTTGAPSDVLTGGGNSTNSTELVNFAGIVQYSAKDSKTLFEGGVAVRTYNADPETNLIAPIGSLVLRRNGSVGTSVYQKIAGTGGLGWRPIAVVSPNTCTLTANAGTTTVNNTNVTATSRILLFPTSANAAADVGSAGGVWISAKVVDTSFTITHPNNANADKTFDYIIVN